MKAKKILFRIVTAVFLISTLLLSSASVSIAADDGAYNQVAQYNSYKKGLSEYILTVSPGVGSASAEQMAAIYSSGEGARCRSETAHGDFKA